jgi:predicted ATP-grasp superfamily ATP-dependent carboligase
MGFVPIVDGVINGVSGGILSRAALTHQDVTALLAPTSTIFPSPQSAVALLKLLGSLLPNIKICVHELEELSKDMEKVTTSVLKSIPLKAKNVPPSSLYT